MEPERGYNPPRRPRWGIVLLIALLHVGIGIGLMRAFAPDYTNALADRAASTMTVFITAPKDPPPPPPTPAERPAPDEGAAAEEGQQAVPREVIAPEPAIPVPRPSPAPRASSTSAADQAGAAEAGSGTGAGGMGSGTGSGRSGSGSGSGAGNGLGGMAATRPVKTAGDIRSAADYPAPPGGRQARFGQSVTIAMTVGTDGRASDCRVIAPSNDPVADRTTCELAVARFRFEPARDAEGNPVPAIFGWRQEFFRR